MKPWCVRTPLLRALTQHSHHGCNNDPTAAATNVATAAATSADVAAAASYSNKLLSDLSCSQQVKLETVSKSSFAKSYSGKLSVLDLILSNTKL